MKKGMKIALGIILPVIIAFIGIAGYKIFSDNGNENGNGGDDTTFDNEERYDDSILNNMTVIYESQSDIIAWNEGCRILINVHGDLYMKA